MFLSGAWRRRILGSDTIAGDVFGAGASGLAARRYGINFSDQKYKPVVLSGRPADTLIWDGVEHA